MEDENDESWLYGNAEQKDGQQAADEEAPEEELKEPEAPPEEAKEATKVS